MKRNQGGGSVPSMQNVAAYAGVSVATVSKVMQGDGTVRPENVVAVQNAIEALGYRINPVAAELRRGRRKMIGVVLPRFDRTTAALARAIEIHAHRHGYATWVEVSDGSEERENLLLGRMKDWRVAGFVLWPVRPGRAGPRLLLEDVATVCVGDDVSDDFDAVLVHAETAAKSLASILAEGGCRHLLVLSREGAGNVADCLVKHLTSEWAIGAPGAVFDREVLNEEPIRASARVAYLLEGTRRPAAILALDDVVEAMVATYAAVRDTADPDDLRFIVCRPATKAAGTLSHTSVNYPDNDVAAKAVELLLLRIEDSGASKATAVTSLSLSLGRPS